MHSRSATPTTALGSRRVHRVGYGAMRLLGLHDRPTEAARVLEAALEAGVDHFDTADYYGSGLVNGFLKKVVVGRPNVVVATKVGAVGIPGGPMNLRPAQRPEELRAGVEANIRSLGVAHLDLVNLRRHAGDAATAVDVQDQLAELVRMQGAGLIAEICISEVDLKTLQIAIPAGIVCVQNRYSVLDRRDEALLALSEKHGVAWVPYFPLGGGGAAGAPIVTNDPTIITLAASLGITPSQLALAWLLHHSRAVALIAGTTSLEHLRENTAASLIELPSVVIENLDGLTSKS